MPSLDSPPTIDPEAVCPTASNRILGRTVTDARRERGGGGEDVAEYEAYCVKCKTKRKFDGEEVTMKNGRRAARGKCPVCGTTMNRILGNK